MIAGKRWEAVIELAMTTGLRLGEFSGCTGPTSTSPKDRSRDAEFWVRWNSQMVQLPKRSGEYLFEIITRRHELRSTLSAC